MGEIQYTIGASTTASGALANATEQQDSQKDASLKGLMYPGAILGCTATLGSCVVLGNDLISDVRNMLDPSNAGNYNIIRGTIETGVKYVGVPEQYQGLVTDIGYFGTNVGISGLGKWESIENGLNKIKLPISGQPQTEVEIAGFGKVKIDADDFNSQISKSTGNSGGGSSSSKIYSPVETGTKMDPFIKQVSSNTKINEVLNESTIGTNTKKFINFDSNKKGYGNTLKDFEAMGLKNVKETVISDGSKGFVGYLEDGTSVSIREFSKSEGPTMDIINGSKKIKVRY